MEPIENPAKPLPPNKRLGPFRRAVLRGLAVVLPPLLTIVIFLWIGNTVASYLLVPLENAARYILVDQMADIRPMGQGPLPERVNGAYRIEGRLYRPTPAPDNKYVPLEVYDAVERNVRLGRLGRMPDNAREIYTSYVNQTYLRREYVIPAFTLLFVLMLWLLGKFLAAGVGRFFWNYFERLIDRLPLVRNVYSSVKQVTDLFISEQELKFTRVVAIEYPRKGIWTLAMVMGESFMEIYEIAGEPVYAVLIPTSPMPFTGFTITVRRSETVEMNLTIDQALQFVVSCGVVVPPHQIAQALGAKEKQTAARERPALLAPAAEE